MIPGHFYVHAPFCARRCSYCDFAVTVDSAPQADAWLEAIDRELSVVRAEEQWPVLPMRTLYVGGGTPSLLGPGAMAGLARLLTRATVPEGAVEWTAEANPERFDVRLAVDWIEAGVNRVSLGAQTFDPEVLRWMGRLHGPDGPARAVRAAREAGFDNLSLDLIFGLPGRFARDWQTDLDRALALEPDHVSLYGLTAEKATPLGRWVDEGRERMPSEEAYEEEYLLAAERLVGAGFVHYEVSNFARPGRESRHNRAYWAGVSYVGLGPGAHSYAPPRRWWNVRDWAEYRRRTASGERPLDGEETVGKPAAQLERVWLSLRTVDGIEPESDGQHGMAADWIRRGWAEPAAAPVSQQGGGPARIRLTARGWLLLDRLAVDFDAARGPAADLPVVGRTGSVAAP